MKSNIKYNNKVKIKITYILYMIIYIVLESIFFLKYIIIFLAFRSIRIYYNIKIHFETKIIVDFSFFYIAQWR